MSYILDALNKSERERQQQEPAPGLQAAFGSGADSHSVQNWVFYILLFVGFSVALLLGGYWLSFQFEQPGKKLDSTPINAPQIMSERARRQSKNITEISTANRIKLSSEQVNDNRLSEQDGEGYESGGVRNASAQGRGELGSHANLGGSGVTDVHSLYQQSKLEALEQVSASETLMNNGRALPHGDASANKTIERKGKETIEAQQIKSASVGGQRIEPQTQHGEIDYEKVAAAIAKEINLLHDEQGNAQQEVPKKQVRVTPKRYVPHVSEIPDHIQQAIPSIDYSAHVYAIDEGTGFVVLNGSTRYPGDRVGADIVVKEIRDDGVVLSYQGTEFSLNAMRNWIND